MKIAKKLLLPFTLALSLGAFIISPVSNADGWYANHWHWAQTRVKIRGCRKIMVRRFTRVDRWGNHHVERVRTVRWIC